MSDCPVDVSSDISDNLPVYLDAADCYVLSHNPANDIEHGGRISKHHTTCPDGLVSEKSQEGADGLRKKATKAKEVAERAKMIDVKANKSREDRIGIQLTSFKL